MITLGYFGALLTGMSLGLVGAGGSILIVPILVYLFGVRPEIATAYSLFIVGTTSIVGALRYRRQDLVDLRMAIVFGIPAFIGVYVARRFIVPALPDVLFQAGPVFIDKGHFIMATFAVVMIGAAVAMIRQTDGGAASDSGGPNAGSSARRLPLSLIVIEGLLVGSVTGFVGAGGGFLIIPALVLLAKVPMKIAVGTSLVIIATKSLLGLLGDASRFSEFDWSLLGFVTLVAMVGIYLGSLLQPRISAARLRPAFGWFVLAMGAYILTMQIV